MSKYFTYTDRVYASRECLLAALKDLGYETVEEGDALPLYGYRGDRRAETAQLVVRRQYVGAASNDLGFGRTEKGYVPIISEYDMRTLRGGQFLRDLGLAYGEAVARELARRLRGSVRRTVQGSVIKLVVRY
jgi:hypothetical protein